MFVRHALPGERVRALVTEGTDGDPFLRADAVEVMESATERVTPSCAVSGPGGCGGCDFQHVSLSGQRELLGAVVREQLRRLAGVEWEGEVESADDADGLGWRTRVQFAVSGAGRLGLHRHRSHDVIELDGCPIAHPAFDDLTAERWRGRGVEAVVSSSGERLLVVDERSGVPDIDVHGVVDSRGRRVRGRSYVTETVLDRSFGVSGGGFWQVHPQAAETLVRAVLGAGRPQPGETALDLYSGVGLFTAFIADAVGPFGSVVAVEGAAIAVRDAEHNVGSMPGVRLVHAPVDRALARSELAQRCDLVVLDPPRVGAKAKIVHQIARRTPSRVVYVACDPAALARDVSTFADCGYRLASLRAFALFPMTHHVECVALLTREA